MASLAEPLRRRYHKTYIYSKRTRTKGRRRRSIAMRQVNDDGNLSYIIMTFTYIVFGCSVIPYRSFSPLASIVSTLFSDRIARKVATAPRLVRPRHLTKVKHTYSDEGGPQ